MAVFIQITHLVVLSIWELHGKIIYINGPVFLLVFIVLLLYIAGRDSKSVLVFAFVEYCSFHVELSFLLFISLYVLSLEYLFITV